MKKSRGGIEGRVVGGVHDHGVRRGGRFVFGATQRVQSFEDMVERVELLTIREVRKVRQTGGHARVFAHCHEHRALPFPGSERSPRPHRRAPHIADRAEPKLADHAPDRDPASEHIAPEKCGTRLRHAEPEQRQQRRGIVKVHAPFGLPPREQMLEENRRGHDQPARTQHWQQEKWHEQSPREIAALEAVPQRSGPLCRMRHESAEDRAAGISEMRIQLEEIHAAAIQRRPDEDRAEHKPPERDAAGDDVPADAPFAVAVAFDEIIHDGNPREQQPHAFLAREHEDEREPEKPRPAFHPRLEHEQEQRGGERLGVKFMQCDEAGGRREQGRESQPDGGLRTEFQMPRDAPAGEWHGREEQRLRDDEQHRVRPDFIKWQREKNDRVLVIAHERHIKQRHMPCAFAREPQPLRVECEVESRVLKSRPAEP